MILTVSAAAAISGCAGPGYEFTAQSRAQRYIYEKYGFNAEVTDVLTAQNGWLDFSWEAPEFAHVRMKHNGTEFVVLVPIRDDDFSFLCDSYEENIICAEIEDYVRKQLSCEDLAIRIDYGNNYGNHLLPQDIRSAGDLKKSSQQKTITVFTRGLDTETVEKLDPDVYGENTNISLVEWQGAEFPEVPYGLIRELPSQCGWNVSSVHYTQNDGSWAEINFDRIVIGNICLVMPTECGISIEPADGPEEPDDIPVTDWYCIKGTGEGYGALYAAVGAAPDDEYCLEYEHKGKAYYQRMPHVDGYAPEYELCNHQYCSGKEDDFIFRVVKRDFYKSSQG